LCAGISIHFFFEKNNPLIDHTFKADRSESPFSKCKKRSRTSSVA
jgi:hypothetical protein